MGQAKFSLWIILRVITYKSPNNGNFGGDIAQKLHLGEILPALFDDFECAKTVSADINKQ